MSKSPEKPKHFPLSALLILAFLIVISIATVAGYRLNLSAEVDGKGRAQINFDPPQVKAGERP